MVLLPLLLLAVPAQAWLAGQGTARNSAAESATAEQLDLAPLPAYPPRLVQLKVEYAVQPPAIDVQRASRAVAVFAYPCARPCPLSLTLSRSLSVSLCALSTLPAHVQLGDRALCRAGSRPRQLHSDRLGARHTGACQSPDRARQPFDFRGLTHSKCRCVPTCGSHLTEYLRQ